MSDRAVITLQAGNYANHVGAHFWNLQESQFVYTNAVNDDDSIDHDALFREGRTLARGEVTFTPRLVAVDLRGALGSMPALGDLYADPGGGVPRAESLLWDGETEVKKEEPRKKNDFQRELKARERISADEDKDVCEAESGDDSVNNKDGDSGLNLEDQVRFWPDYLSPRLHPRSNVALREFQHGNALEPFDVFGLGVAAWRGENGAGEEVEDAVRFFAEEADVLQGFHVVCDSSDGFGGVASLLMDHLSDHYAGKSAVAFPVTPCPAATSSTPARNSAAFLNQVLTLSAAAASPFLTTPLSLSTDAFPLPGGHRAMPGVEYRPELPYHTSAVIAAAVELATLPWRRKADRVVKLYDVAGVLGAGGRKIASIDVALPLNVGRDRYFSQILQDGLASQMTSLLPIRSNDVDVIKPSQAVTVRGVSPKDLFPQSEKKTEPYLSCNSAKGAIEAHLSTQRPFVPTGVTEMRSGLPLNRPFPRLFTEIGDASSLPAASAWHASRASAGAICRSLSERGAKVNLGRMHRFVEAGLEQDDLTEAVETLAQTADAYEDGMI